MEKSKMGMMAILGLVVGVIVGFLTHNFWLWLIIGAIVGVIIGAIIDSGNKNKSTPANVK